MSNIRIKDLSTEATSLGTDDFIPVDGNTSGTRRISKENLGTTLEIPDVGTAPNETPLNQHLGSLAYQDADSVSVAELQVESTTGTGTTEALTVTDGSSTKFVVQEDGRTGINNSSPGTNANNNADDLVVGNGGEHGITIYSGTGDSGRLFFSDGTGTSTYRGYIRYDHGSNELLFGTNSSQRAVIDSTGRVGIGTSSPPQKLTVQGGGVQIAGAITSPASGVSALLLDWVSSNSRYWSRGADATTQGTHNFYVLENDGGNQVNALEVNASGIKFPASGLGIDFGSGASTTIDSYEEGSWSPTVGFITAGPTAGASAAYSGKYTRIGRMVYCSIDLDFDDAATSIAVDDRWTMTGLPFSAASELQTYTGAGSFIVYGSIATGVNAFGAVGISQTSDTVLFYVTHLDGTFGYDYNIRAQFSYETDA